MRGGAEWDGIRVAEADFHDAFHPAHAPFVPLTAPARSRVCRSGVAGAYGRYATSGSDCVGGLVRAENEDNGLTASARCTFAVRVSRAHTADARLPAMFVGTGLSTRKARTTCRRRAHSRGCRSGIAGAQECRSRIDRLLSHSGSFAGAYSRRAYCGAGCEGARNGTESAWRKPIFTMRFIRRTLPSFRRRLPRNRAFAVRVSLVHTADTRLPAAIAWVGLSARRTGKTHRRLSRVCRSSTADAQECRSRIDRLLSHSGSFAGAYSRRAYCGAGCEGARNGTESAWRKPIFTMRFISGGIPPSRR